MAYDEGLAQRVRELFEEKPEFNEKKMLGGVCLTCTLISKKWGQNGVKSTIDP